MGIFSAAAEAMRRLLVDNAQRKQSLNRGGDLKRVSLCDVDPAMLSADENLLALNEALHELGDCRFNRCLNLAQDRRLG